MRNYCCVLVLIFGLSTWSGYSQNCNDTELHHLPGTWNAGTPGSVHNVAAADLAKEKTMVGKLHASVSKAYSPLGGNITYGGVYGYNSYEGKNWKADPYEFYMYFKRFRCEPFPKNGIQYGPEAETPTTVSISVNHVWSHQGKFELWPADLPDDHHTGYLRFDHWPEKQGEYYYWLIAEPGDRVHKKEYVWLITYDNQLPISPLTREEYLLIKIPRMKAYLEELQNGLKDIDPNFDAFSKRTYDGALESIEAQEKHIADTEALLQSMNTAERNTTAIIYGGDSNGEFTGFKDPGEPYAVYLAKPNSAYYNSKLPKWVPQFFCILFQLDTGDPVYKANIEAIEKAIDIPKLRSMLGNMVVPAAN